MSVYKYIVSETPANWAEGRAFDTIQEARYFAKKYSECVTEISFTFNGSELVEDHRKKSREDLAEDVA